MESKIRIHPLVAGASVAVIVLSLVGVATMTGHLPGSNADKASEPQSVPSVTPSSQKSANQPVHKPAAHAGAPKQVVAGAAPVAKAKPLCPDCGVVQEVKEVEVKGEGTGLGAVAGGVAGALVGSQIGSGRGKTLAEVAGAAGGAYAGHQIEKKVRSHKQFDVSVHMEDGSVRTVSSETQPTWRAGDHVRIQDGKLEPVQ